MPQNYTLGRGKIYFAPFKSGTQDPSGERYFGNTPELSITVEEESLDHYSSEEGINEKDDSISLQVDRSGTLVTDNISYESLAYFFFGSSDALTVIGATVTDESITDVNLGTFYQLGASATNPGGARELTDTVSVTDSGGVTTYVEDTDYKVDLTLGRIEILESGSITEGEEILVTYTTQDSTRSRVLSGSSPIEGQLRFIAYNPKGEDIDYLMPWVKVTPNGDYALKSGDEWQQIPFSLEVLKKTGYEAVYGEGRAVVS